MSDHSIVDQSFFTSNNNSQQAYPNLGQSWALIVLFFVFTIAIGLFLSFTKNIVDKNSVTKNWLDFCTYLIPFILLYLYIKSKFKDEGKNQIPLYGHKTSWIVFAVLLLVTPLLAVIMEPVVSLIPQPKWFEDAMKDIIKLNLPSFLTVVIAAPLCEEFLLRGVILDGLLRNKLSPRSAIMWSALMFAVLHLNPWQGIHAFAIGCLMGWVYYKTRSLWTTIFIHFVNNGLAFLVYFLIKNPNVTTKDIVPDNTYLYTYLLAILLAGVLTYGLYLFLKKQPQPDFD